MGVGLHYCREYGDIDVTTLSNVTVRHSMTVAAHITHDKMDQAFYLQNTTYT